MANYKCRIINSATSVIAVLFITVHVAVAAEPISFDDFMQCFENAVASEMANDNKDSSMLLVSKLPHEILDFMKEELYDNRVLKNLATTSKDELTNILRNDVKSRKIYFEKNIDVFESFTMKVLYKDIKNYPDEKSGENPMEIMFLSKMTMEDVDKIIEDTIIDKGATLEESWKVLTLKDAFRTIFFYCKYPKEMAAIFTENMRDEVKEWLDSTSTWGNWGFDDEPVINITDTLKLEL